MVCYCPERKILFIHLPKNGGLTIESILLKTYGFKHFTFPGTNDPYPFLRDPRGKIGFFRYILKYSNESKTIDFSKYRKFAVVRNPFTRGESAIRYLHKSSARVSAGRDINGKIFVKKGHFPLGIERFYRTCLTRDYYYMHFCLSQTRSLEDLEGNIDFDIVRFENLIPEMKRLLFDEYGLEPSEIEKVHVNKSNKNNLGVDIEHVRNKVKQIHKEDFEILGYDIDEPYIPKKEEQDALADQDQDAYGRDEEGEEEEGEGREIDL